MSLVNILLEIQDSMFTGFTFKMKLLGSYIKDLFAHIIQNETMFDEK